VAGWLRVGVVAGAGMRLDGWVGSYIGAFGLGDWSGNRTDMVWEVNGHLSRDQLHVVSNHLSRMYRHRILVCGEGHISHYLNIVVARPNLPYLTPRHPVNVVNRP